jgi:hypothetical protein
MAQQSGYIFRKGDSWFLRYRDAGKQRCKKLANVCDRYRREKDVQALAAEFLAPPNAGRVRPESYITVSDFAANHWLPWAQANCKPSTVAGYQAFWKLYLGPHMPRISLRDFRTVDACNLFAETYRRHKVSRRGSVWHTPTTAPKTTEAAAPVPLIPVLAEILSELRQADGNPTDGPILRGPSGKPLLLDNVSQRVIVPLLRGCAVCGKPESGHKAAHAFKLDESLPAWHGFYSLRRGVTTTLASLTKMARRRKGLLRHTNIATTMRYYVKDGPANTQAGMDLLENLCNQSATESGAQPN